MSPTTLRIPGVDPEVEPSEVSYYAVIILKPGNHEACVDDVDKA